MTVFALPPGADFPAALVDGLLARYGALPPEDFARIELWVNTRRMERRIARSFRGTGRGCSPGSA
jgi:ATP-dependent helicase/nuclease subunit B